eukprot:1145510-Pelagomonas_calceolata.AAC.4
MAGTMQTQGSVRRAYGGVISAETVHAYMQDGNLLVHHRNASILSQKDGSPNAENAQRLAAVGRPGKASLHIRPWHKQTTPRAPPACSCRTAVGPEHIMQHTSSIPPAHFQHTPQGIPPVYIIRYTSHILPAYI